MTHPSTPRHAALATLVLVTITAAACGHPSPAAPDAAASSKDAAAAIRTFTDEQLDTAAPFGLAFGCPVTSQFVIEDHAVRHSWHHLARIKQALGK